MGGSYHHKPRRELPRPSTHRRHWWCCTLTVPPRSPENYDAISNYHQRQRSKQVGKTELPSKPAASFPNSPQSHKPSLVGRILSPGRVSPIDSIQESAAVLPLNPSPPRSSFAGSLPDDTSRSMGERTAGNPGNDEGSVGDLFDVRLSLKGKSGASLVLELSSEVLSASCSVFADLIANYRKNSTGSGPNLCRIEIPDVENLNLFRETIELMFEDEITKRLSNIGVYRSIDILEVSTGIKFNRGILSCLKYLEAVPWSEEEEEKLRNLFSRFSFGEEASKEILDRLYSFESANAEQTLARHLVSSITSCVDSRARNELKPLVKGLLCKSSVYEKDYPDLTKEDILAVCQSCLSSLVTLFEEATGTNACGKMAEKKTEKPLMQCISKQVDNVIWLLEILLDWQMAEDFVNLWIDQKEFLRMHTSASPMIRYELSRVSAVILIAMGTRQLHCRSEAREGLVQAWFRPMLSDFGWLQRCKKGLNMKILEEAMGQVLLTLPLKQQYIFFMEWFQCISKHGTECPNLSKAFQIWWRRSFLRGSESYAIESR